MMTATRARFVELVNSGNKQAVQNAINKNKYDINEQTYTGHTAVHAAIERNDYEMLKLLINSGANVNIKSDLGETPLSLAKAMARDDKKYFNTEIIKLIEKTLSTNAVSSIPTVKVPQTNQDKTSNKHAISQCGLFPESEAGNEEQSTSAKRSKKRETAKKVYGIK